MLGLLEALDRARLVPLLVTSALVAARLGPLTVLAPFLHVPRSAPLLRAVLVVGLTVALAPLAFASAAALPTDVASFTLALAREAVLGLVFAFAASLPFFALAWAGQLTDALRGASMGELASVGTDEGTTPLGQLYLLLGVVLFVVVGGPRVALSLFAEGLVASPIGAPLATASLSEVALGSARLSGLALALALAVAAPAAVAVVLVDVVLGLLGRAAPQIPLHFAGMPLRAAVGIAACLLGLSVVVDGLAETFRAALDAGADLLRGLAG